MSYEKLIASQTQSKKKKKIPEIWGRFLYIAAFYSFSSSPC